MQRVSRSALTPTSETGCQNFPGRSAFQSHRFELLSDVERRKFPATRTCAATLDAIVRKKLDMSTQGIFTDRARQRCARRDSLATAPDATAMIAETVINRFLFS